MTNMREGTPEEAGFDAERIELIRQRGAQWAEQSNTQGLVLLVARNGVICLEEAWGDLTGEPDSPPMNTDSIFMLASLAKPVTAAAAMILVEDGLLGLTRPLNYYIPELRGEGSEEVLVQHLLTHTAGYGDERAIAHATDYIMSGQELPPCPEQLALPIHQQLEAYYTMPVEPGPGTLMVYGIAHYVLLGEVIRRISGMKFEDFVRTRLFEPLGMRDSAFGYDDSMQPRFAEMDLTNLVDDVELAKQYTFFAPNAGGGLFGTVGDYARFAQMLANGGTLDGQRILGRAAVGQMMRNQIPGIPVDFAGREYRGNWGYGLMLFDEQGWPWFHGGLLAAGCVSHSGVGGPSFWVDREQGVVGVYFVTCLDLDANTGDLRWDFDLFQNLVTAAVID